MKFIINKGGTAGVGAGILLYRIGFARKHHPDLRCKPLIA